MSTKIQWTTDTWNPLAGCTKISDGCKNCYAIKDAVRLAGNPNPKIAEKYAGTTAAMNWTGKINLASEEILTQPLRWTRPRKIFVNSMSDLFHESVPDEWIDKIFAVIALSPQHTFQILTKRAERMRDYFAIRSFREIEIACNKVILSRDLIAINQPDPPKDLIERPLKNVWLGVSVENQKAADERIPYLLETPAAVRFLSCEPLLSKIDLKLPTKKFIRSDNSEGCSHCCFGDRCDDASHYNRESCPYCRGTGKGKLIDWVIVGGESGNGARRCDIDWIRLIVGQCKDAGVKVFVKQLGAEPFTELKSQTGLNFALAGILGVSLPITDKKGGNIEDFPLDLQVREFPQTGETI